MYLAILLTLAGLAQDDSWIEKLSSDDPKTRQSASEQLVKEGEKILPKLRDVLKQATDPEVQSRLKSIVAEIEHQVVLKKLKIEVVLPKEAPTLKAVNKGSYKFTIRITNETDGDLIVWPFTSAKVFDKDGTEVKYSTLIGSGGKLYKKCFLEAPTFWKIAPKETKEIVESLFNFTLEFEAIVGWKLPSAGEYTLNLTFAYDRKTYKARCAKACAHHDDADQPWNKALEFERTVTVKLKVSD